MILIGIFLLLLWGSLLTFWWFKADAITRDPCSLCAEQLGEEIRCTTSGLNPISKSFYQNGSSHVNLPAPPELFR
jgi:hypothetical protein